MVLTVYKVKQISVSRHTYGYIVSINKPLICFFLSIVVKIDGTSVFYLNEYLLYACIKL